MALRQPDLAGLSGIAGILDKVTFTNLYSSEFLYKGRPAAQDSTVLRIRIKRRSLRSLLLRPVSPVHANKKNVLRILLWNRRVFWYKAKEQSEKHVCDSINPLTARRWRRGEETLGVIFKRSRK